MVAIGWALIGRLSSNQAQPLEKVASKSSERRLMTEFAQLFNECMRQCAVQYEAMRDETNRIQALLNQVIVSLTKTTGEEPYTLAMTPCEAFDMLTPPYRSIASDIDTNVLNTAQKGMHPIERVEKLSTQRLHSYFLNGAGAQEGFVRVRPKLQKLVSFMRADLLDDRWPNVSGPLDVIFCRNVMIYFDKATQYQILRKFVPLLREDGLMFAGHSESFLHAADSVPSLEEPFMNAQTPGAKSGGIDHLANNRYFDRTFHVEAVKLLPGEYFATTSELALVTVPGSCASACIRDRDKGIGGMNHFMLAEGENTSSSIATSARYGTFSVEVFINHLNKLGARRGRLETKVFGGGRVMASLTSSKVDEQNSHFVLEYLKTEGIPVTAQDLLDIYPRKVYFFPSNGRLLVKKLVRQHNETLVRREREYAARLTEAPVSGDIELFT